MKNQEECLLGLATLCVAKTYWDLNLYQSALLSIHVWVIKEKFVILYTEFKWRIGVHFGQNAAKNNDLLKKRFE